MKSIKLQDILKITNPSNSTTVPIITSTTTFFCTKCTQDKPISEKYPSDIYCKKCRIKITKEYRDKQIFIEALKFWKSISSTPEFSSVQNIMPGIVPQKYHAFEEITAFHLTSIHRKLWHIYIKAYIALYEPSLYNTILKRTAEITPITPKLIEICLQNIRPKLHLLRRLKVCSKCKKKKQTYMKPFESSLPLSYEEQLTLPIDDITYYNLLSAPANMKLLPHSFIRQHVSKDGWSSKCIKCLFNMSPEEYLTSQKKFRNPRKTAIEQTKFVYDNDYSNYTKTQDDFEDLYDRLHAPTTSIEFDLE